MAIDLVHDTQAIFRTVLHCMSRPGKIENIEEIGRPIGQHEYCPHSMYVLAMTLLDAEVRFHVVGEHTADIGEFLSAFTFSKVTSIQEADFIFVMKDASKEEIRETFTSAKKGSLTSPEQSATILIETESLSYGQSLTLEGPGIKHTENVAIEAHELWLAHRAEANQEFPLGVDLIFIDRLSNMMCLPRTTIIHECEGM